MATWANENRVTVRLDREALVRLRQEADMLQRDLAEAAGLNAPVLCDYERGRRGNVRREVVDRLAGALGRKLGRKVTARELILAAEPAPAEVAS